MLYRVLPLPYYIRKYAFRYELPEQHEPLVVLIPEEGAPQNGMDSDCLAEEIKGRRAAGATATLVFDEALRDTAREGGFLFEEGVMVAAKSSLAECNACQVEYSVQQ